LRCLKPKPDRADIVMVLRRAKRSRRPAPNGMTTPVRVALFVVWGETRFRPISLCVILRLINEIESSTPAWRSP
jgi:hypothetical protein